MLKSKVSEIAGRAVLLVDTITALTNEDAGALVISGSHGGASAGAIALVYSPSFVAFNDAGVGKDRAGIVALDMFEAEALPAVTVSHLSARIGDAADMWENGVISHANQTAKSLGVKPGQVLRDAVSKNLAAMPRFLAQGN